MIPKNLDHIHLAHSAKLCVSRDKYKLKFENIIIVVIYYYYEALEIIIKLKLMKRMKKTIIKMSHQTNYYVD